MDRDENGKFIKGHAFGKGIPKPHGSPEQAIKIGNALRGKNYPNKVPPSFAGRCHTDETKSKLRLARAKRPLKTGTLGYAALHMAVVRKYGKPSICANCGTLVAKKYEWASIDHNYTDIDSYVRLCTECHRLVDGVTQ